MGNGVAPAKAAAQHVVGHNDAEGWSEAMERFVIAPIEASGAIKRGAAVGFHAPS